MNQDQLLILEHKEIIPLKIERMTVFLRSKIIEALNEKQEVYYLFFYENNYLNTFKASKLRLQSFISQAFQKGIIFQSPHPIISQMISSEHPYKVQSFNQLVKKLQNHYNAQKTAFILTFFESFVPKKEIFNKIQEIFYQLRRDGQLFACYQILRTLSGFATKNSWVKQLLHDMNFMKYADLYKHYSEELLNKDAIFAEKWLFTKRVAPQYFNSLEASLKKDGCFIDIVSLHVDRFQSSTNKEHYQALLSQLQLIFDEKEICQILAHLSSQLPHYRELQNDFLEKLLEFGKFEEATRFMANGKIFPTSLHPEVQNKLIEQILSNPASLHYEGLNTFLIPLAVSDPDKADKTIQKCVTELLQLHDIEYVQKWLASIKSEQPNLPIYKKIDHLEQYCDNPDEQFALGKLYFELMQYERAIDCFSWEMELHSSDPRPVQWLAKIYKKLGNDSEFEAYQHLLEKGVWFQEGVH